MKRLWFALLAIALSASAASAIAIAQQPPGKAQPPRGGAAPGRPMQRGDQPPGSEGYDPRGGAPGRRPGSPDPRGMGRGGSISPGMGPRGGELDRLEQDDPEMYEFVKEDMRLEVAALDLANQYRSTKPADREKLRAELAVEVNKHFEVRQKRRELQLRRMEEELARLREAIEARHKGREEIVQKRLTELVGEPQDLEF